jgi:hypothetical protein
MSIIDSSLFIKKPKTMVKTTKQSSLEYLKNLLMSPQENEGLIITIMVRDHISIPKILTSVLTEKNDAQEHLLRSLCDLTGYSFDKLLESRPELIKTFREENPSICKGCEQRMEVWSKKFRGAMDEFKAFKENTACIDFSTKPNVVSS